MAEVRKSAKQTQARKRAREKAAEFRAQQDQLEQLAVDYFVAADSLDEIQDETERQIAALREKAEKQSESARRDADVVVQKMLGLVNRTEVAARLGINVRDVKKASDSPTSAAPAEVTSAVESDQDTTTTDTTNQDQHSSQEQPEFV
jgi:hypothetical protein